jgi:hypothetical protein
MECIPEFVVGGALTSPPEETDEVDEEREDRGEVLMAAGAYGDSAKAYFGCEYTIPMVVYIFESFTNIPTILINPHITRK